MKKKIFSLLTISILLTSCNGVSDLKFVPYTDYVTEQDLMRDYEDGLFYSRKNPTCIDTYCGTVTNQEDLLSLTSSDLIKKCVAPKGEKKLLVIPISFADSNMPSLTDKHTYIENAFFGETKRTSYDSVAGYYNKTSYGQLKITGEVAPWFRLDSLKADDWQSISTDHKKVSTTLVCKAVDWLKEKNLIENIDQYDTDGDGYLDAVFAIYDHPFNEDGSTSTLFWAYVFYTRPGEFDLNKVAPYVNAYAWSSVDKIKGKGNLANTNYLIHEVGHLFGLSDYYNIYASDVGDTFHYGPTGCFDMMDYNIGDHCSFSKYLLNWTSPLVVKKNIQGIVTLPSFQSSGQYLLIPSSNYNNSPYGEYLLVEYFTPEGLNKFSGSYTYTAKGGKTGTFTYPQHHGVRIYHIDATLGYYQKGRSGASCICTVNDPDYIEKIGNKVVGLEFAYSNSITDYKATHGEPVLIHLLESSGQNTFLDGIPANNDTLFKIDSDFGITKFTDFTFNTGEKVNFKMRVKAVSSKEATLEISTLED